MYGEFRFRGVFISSLTASASNRCDRGGIIDIYVYSICYTRIRCDHFARMFSPAKKRAAVSFGLSVINIYVNISAAYLGPLAKIPFVRLL